MALCFRAAGWNGLHLLFGVALGLTAAIVAGGVRARIAAMPAFLVSLVGLACLSGSVLARPHLLALPLLALWTLELLNARDGKRAPRWWLLPVMLLWANLHGSFAFGLALAAAFALEAVLADRAALKGWGLFFVASVVAAAITPQFIHGLLFPFQLLVMGSIRNIGEWAPADFSKLTPFPIALACLFYLGVTGKLKLTLLRAAMVVGLTYLALAHMRHEMLFGIVVPLLVADALVRTYPPQDVALPAWLAPAVAAIFVLLVAARLVVPTVRGDDRVTPMTALAQLPPALRAQPVLNGYDFGGYLIFSGVKVYVDGRTDMYGDAFLENYDLMMKPDRAALMDTLARRHIAWSILPPGPAADLIGTLPGWRRVYHDGFAVVDVKS